MSQVEPQALALQRLYQWEKTMSDKLLFTQPYEGAAKGNGQVRTWTWKQAMD